MSRRKDADQVAVLLVLVTGVVVLLAAVYGAWSFGVQVIAPLIAGR